mmetsp:Transcript_18889/g.47063  ORF Transcript_18889/g.47063 Transcript_18889/m.47063 type:complete len:251 (-) Transcript_18889:570-1322(-)
MSPSLSHRRAASSAISIFLAASGSSSPTSITDSCALGMENALSAVDCACAPLCENSAAVVAPDLEATSTRQRGRLATRVNTSQDAPSSQCASSTRTTPGDASPSTYVQNSVMRFLRPCSGPIWIDSELLMVFIIIEEVDDRAREPMLVLLVLLFISPFSSLSLGTAVDGVDSREEALFLLFLAGARSLSPCSVSSAAAAGAASAEGPVVMVFRPAVAWPWRDGSSLASHAESAAFVQTARSAASQALLLM